MCKKDTQTIHVFDIDDTLLISSSKVYYFLPNDTKEYSVSTSEFAILRNNMPKNTQYDLRDFEEFESIYTGITTGKPNIPILKQLDKAVLAGHKIGILTARGNQSAVLASVKDKILFKDSCGNLKKIPRSQFRKRWVFAVSDDKTHAALKGMGSEGDRMLAPQKLKSFVLQKILGDIQGFKHIIFYDDDEQNIQAVQELNDPRITGIHVKN